MPRIPIVILGVVAALAVASQVLLPAYVEGEVAERLERGGGDARVSLSAFPALRLLADDGESIAVEGSGLELDLEVEPIEAFERLDGFDEARIALRDLEAGPLEVSWFELERGEEDERYELRMDAQTSPRELARYIGRRAGGSLGGVLGDAFAGVVLPEPGTPLPIELQAEIESERGQARAVSTGGSVAGIPAGPLAEIVVDAVVRRL
jgi:hypothetical protein